MRAVWSGASSNAFRHDRRVSFNQPLAGGENFLVQPRGGIARDAYVVHLLQRDARRTQAIIDRLRRKSRAMLDAIEALFLDGRDQFAVFDERGRRVTMECIDAENVQGLKGRIGQADNGEDGTKSDQCPGVSTFKSCLKSQACHWSFGRAGYRLALPPGFWFLQSSGKRF